MTTLRVLHPTPVTPPVNKHVVEILEKALTRARAGELTSVVVLETGADGLTTSMAGVDNRWTLIGQLSNAIHTLHEH